MIRSPAACRSCATCATERGQACSSTYSEPVACGVPHQLHVQPQAKLATDDPCQCSACIRKQPPPANHHLHQIMTTCIPPASNYDHLPTTCINYHHLHIPPAYHPQYRITTCSPVCLCRVPNQPHVSHRQSHQWHHPASILSPSKHCLGPASRAREAGRGGIRPGLPAGFKRYALVLQQKALSWSCIAS